MTYCGIKLDLLGSSAECKPDWKQAKHANYNINYCIVLFAYMYLFD